MLIHRPPWSFKSLLLLALIAPAPTLADGPPTVVASPVSPTPPLHHHKHKQKRKTGAPAGSNASVTAAGTHATRSGAAAAAGTDSPSMSYGLGPNNPAAPNMGSADHTPGTTGTSGN
jgi:hypothetical protein